VTKGCDECEKEGGNGGKKQASVR